ncbi:diacylglycerol O-acyltransferase 3 [Vitis riparia]|uniref:diacylglycerol O-acyltransferase 3 n=1 Tax=Vitis riparia TaxID=96939 RepID=UPI00155A8DCA|nr:diacylglycerol O-acyltransferase 3 [Vitis riparia]
MEVSGVVFRQVPFFSGAGIDTQSSKSSFSGVSVDSGNRISAFSELRLLGSRDSRVAVRPRKPSGFRDESHLKYYYESPRCGAKKDKDKVTTKKKSKLLKALSKDLSLFSDLGFGVDSDEGLFGEVKGKMISEAAEVLLKQLQQMRAEEKELKRRRKEEKAKLKATRMETMVVCESSSSESSDSECGEVVDMTHLRSGAVVEPIKDESQPVIQEAKGLEEPSLLQPVIQEAKGLEEPGLLQPVTTTLKGECCTAVNTATSVAVDQNEKTQVMGAGAKRIEVCMGGKCKKSGAEALLEEFERVVGVEGAVVGCKCMGKCRVGPNVRVLNSIDGVEAEGMDDSVRTPSNPLCVGVGLQDVGIIVSNFFGETHEDIGLPAPA